MKYTTFLKLTEDVLYPPFPVNESHSPFFRNGYCVSPVPQFRFRNLPCSGADSLVVFFFCDGSVINGVIYFSHQMKKRRRLKNEVS